MDVWRITVVALRRWYVLLPLLGITAALAVLAGSGVKEEVEVTGASMVVPGPVISEVPNPYGGPSDASNAVALVLSSPEIRRQIADAGLIPSYQVAPQTRSNIINFEVRGDTAEIAIETGMEVFRKAAVELRNRQDAARIPKQSQYSIDVLQAPSVSATVADGKLRNMAVVGVLGAALSLLVTIFLDDVVGLLRRRSKRQPGDVAKRWGGRGRGERPTPAEESPEGSRPGGAHGGEHTSPSPDVPGRSAVSDPR